MKALTTQEVIESKILIIRGYKVMIDRDLAIFYGVSTKRLNEQVKRNAKKFPKEFMFQLTKAEKDELVANCDRFKTLKHSTVLPNAFTEHGAIMVATILNSEQAIQTTVLIVNAFVQYRNQFSLQKEFAKKLAQIEQKLVGHDKKFKFAFKLIYELASDPNAFKTNKKQKVIEGFGAGKKNKK